MLTAVVFILGAILGSFYNVLIHRLPRKESIVSPPSHCPGCSSSIRWFDNIPILSYVFLGGKCRSCKTRISWVYPAVELTSGLLGIITLTVWDFTLSALAAYIFLSLLLIMSLIDLKHQIIPDRLTLPGIPLFFGFSFFLPSVTPLNSLLGIILGGGSLYVVAIVYHLIAKREGMGGGDVKLLAMMGAFLGYQAILFILLLSSVAGALIGGIAMAAARKNSTWAIPFGPFLSLAAVVYLFWGAEIVNWYYGVMFSS